MSGCSLGAILKVVYSREHEKHAARAELKDGAFIPARETPSRAHTIKACLEARHFGDFCAPHAEPRAAIAAIHAPDYLEFLENLWPRWCAFKQSSDPGDAFPFVFPARTETRPHRPASLGGQLGYYSFDIGSPFTAGAFDAAFSGAACALSAQQHVTAGAPAAFSLSRPPGHHAYADAYGGYCFLNNAAIAAQGFLADGASRVAILDVDYHHGNGTQAIFYDRADVLFISIHADPAFEYPYFAGAKDEIGSGAGEGANVNLPLPQGTGWDAYGEALEEACRILTAFGPDGFVLSLGADIYRGDPLSTFDLDSGDFTRLGRRLGRLRLPTAILLEGGYAVEELGTNIHNALAGFLDEC